MRLTKALADILVQNHIYRVTVSFSGATASDYENMYFGGDFKKVLANLKYLQNRKAECGSDFPRIEVNSIGFQHHMDKLDDFVELMADHGVSAIQVKSLVEYPDITPQLYGHRCFVRPWVEGKIIERAQSLAKERGVFLSVMVDMVADQDEYDSRVAAYRASYAPTDGRPPEMIAIDRLKDFSQTIPHITTPQPPLPKVEIPPTAAAVDADTALDMQPLARIVDTPDVHCMEPFKTMYVRQDGMVRPCHASAGNAPTFGDCKTVDARTMWDGSAYDVLRHGILDGRYSSRICGNCLRHKLGLSHHWLDHSIPNYLIWHLACFNSLSRDEVKAISATVARMGKNRDIVARHHPDSGRAKGGGQDN